MFPIATLDSMNIRSEFFAALAAAEAGTFWRDLALRVASKRAIEEYKWLGASPAMRQWIGGRQGKRPRVEGMQIQNFPFESSFELDVADVDRDATGQLQVRINDLATRAAQHPDALISALITAGETTGLAYDGQAFFDIDHVSGSSGTQTNDLTATEVPAANVAAGSPFLMTPTECANIIIQSISHMFSFKDDQGEPINQNARRFGVMVHPQQSAALLQAISVEFLTNAVSNPITAGIFNIGGIINGRLPASAIGKVYVFRMDAAIKPFIMQIEKEVDPMVLDRNSEYARDTGHVKCGVDYRGNAGYGEWSSAALVTLS